MKSTWEFSKGMADFCNRKTNVLNGHNAAKIDLRSGRRVNLSVPITWLQRKMGKQML